MKKIKAFLKVAKYFGSKKPIKIIKQIIKTIIPVRVGEIIKRRNEIKLQTLELEVESNKKNMEIVK